MFTLPSLPFETDALQPDMSEATLRVHHGGHHRAYVDKLNELVADTPWAGLTLETLIQRTRGEGDRLQQRIFQNAAQDWNHAMFWSSLAPGGMTSPGPALSALVERDFGSLEALRRQFVELGTGHFGSGWIWSMTRRSLLLPGLTFFSTPKRSPGRAWASPPLVTRASMTTVWADDSFCPPGRPLPSSRRKLSGRSATRARTTASGIREPSARRAKT